MARTANKKGKKDDWPPAELVAQSVAQAKALRKQAKKGGLRFEAYLPSRLAVWLLGLVERGLFLDPDEAASIPLFNCSVGARSSGSRLLAMLGVGLRVAPVQLRAP